MRASPLAASFLAAASFSLPAAAAQGELPKTPPLYLAANCANCHGTDGKGSSAIPSLAGRDREFLETSLKAYKAGIKGATIMHQLSKGYTDEEIAALATYFAQQGLTKK